MKIGIVGYGSLGQFLAAKILAAKAAGKDLDIAFIWNRTPERVSADSSLPQGVLLADLDEFASRNADYIIEVAHPAVVASHGVRFLTHANLIVGSPTALADEGVETALLRQAAVEDGRGLYIPSGALWGANDIKKMSDLGTLHDLTITMKKHPDSLKVAESLRAKCALAPPDGGEYVVYSGPVRPLCPLAPNNVNTMACAAIAASTSLGFNGVTARLVVDRSLSAHVIEIKVGGPPRTNTSERFEVTTLRYNPAVTGQVTGSATYDSFYCSLLVAVAAMGHGLHMC